MAPRRKSSRNAPTLSIAEEQSKACDVDIRSSGSELGGDFYFWLANPKDLESDTKSVIQEVLILYMKELPAMNYAANTGKESTFLEKCVKNGKYCTLLLKSNDDKLPREIIAAITYQLVSADTQYAEIPLAAVNSSFQNKGIGRLLYLELKARLESVGVRTLLCWGDKESEGFWLKQGFTQIGEVNKKGRAQKLPIKADVRRALSFPGGSTLMMSHIFKDCAVKSVRLPTLSLIVKPHDIIGDSEEPDNEFNQIKGSGYSKNEKLGIGKSSADGVGPLPGATCGYVADASGIEECRSDGDLEKCSCSVQVTKKRLWGISSSSLKSKKVKGTHSSDCPLGSWCTDLATKKKIINSFATNHTSATICCGNIIREKNKECIAKISNEKYSSLLVPSTAKCIKIMLMNIADDDKRRNLTKIIEDLGGVVTSNGSESTHVVTGKIRRTFNFCMALCSGCWVISPAWLKESFRKGRFVDEMPFILKEDEYMLTYRCDLKCAVLRAKTNPNALLKGYYIWLATQVQSAVSNISAIIKSAGGNLIKKPTEVNNVSKTIFVACQEDMEEAIQAVEMGILTFSIDWLMSSIMTQELDFEAPQFAESL